MATLLEAAQLGLVMARSLKVLAAAVNAPASEAAAREAEAEIEGAVTAAARQAACEYCEGHGVVAAYEDGLMPCSVCHPAEAATASAPVGKDRCASCGIGQGSDDRTHYPCTICPVSSKDGAP